MPLDATEREGHVWRLTRTPSLQNAYNEANLLFLLDMQKLKAFQLHMALPPDIPTGALPLDPAGALSSVPPFRLELDGGHLYRELSILSTGGDHTLKLSYTPSKPAPYGGVKSSYTPDWVHVILSWEATAVP